MQKVLKHFWIKIIKNNGVQCDCRVWFGVSGQENRCQNNSCNDTQGHRRHCLWEATAREPRHLWSQVSLIIASRALVGLEPKLRHTGHCKDWEKMSWTCRSPSDLPTSPQALNCRSRPGLEPLHRMSRLPCRPRNGAVGLTSFHRRLPFGIFWRILKKRMLFRLPLGQDCRPKTLDCLVDWPMWARNPRTWCPSVYLWTKKYFSIFN